MDFDLRYDSTDYLSTVREKAELLALALQRAKDVSLPEGYDRILIAGMGGSGIAGRFLTRYFEREPIVLIEDYDSDAPITSHSVAFVCSYSGNTEETLTYFQKVAATNATIVVFTSGGQLGELARSRRLPIVNLPPNMQPRVASLMMWFAMIRIFQNSGVASAGEHVQSAIHAIGNEKVQETMEEYAKSLAAKIGDRIPLVYATERLREVGYIWKTNFNENAKTHAFTNVIPELCHNELAAFTEPENYYVILLNDESDSRRLKTRSDVLRSVLNRKGIENSTIMVKGPNTLTKMVNTIHLGELTSIYLGIGHHIDPAEVHTIEEFKKELAKKPF